MAGETLIATIMLVGVSLAAAYTDLARRRISNVLTFGLAAAALVLSATHGALPFVDLKPCILFARHQEVAHVEARLEADDVAAEQTLQDRRPHLPRQHLPVLGCRPRYVDEVLDDGSGQLLTHDLGHEIFGNHSLSD